MKKKMVTGDSERRSRSSEMGRPQAGPTIPNPARIYARPQEARCLDSTELAKLEEAFRSWEQIPSRTDVRASRKRILLIFLLIRYTGARLNEVLAIDLWEDVDPSKRVVRYGNRKAGGDWPVREVQVSSELMSEIQTILGETVLFQQPGPLLKVDAGHVRRKFYERAADCGLSPDLASPNAIRRARAVELMQSNVPLPVVQRILGHSTPNLTASWVSFSEDDIVQVARHFIEKESGRKTSARNTFFGKINDIRVGDIQSRVELVTVGGDVITTVITNNSLERLGLKAGSLVTAEVKAPWVILQKADFEPLCSAENMFLGTVSKILFGRLTSELIVLLHDGTELCSVVTEESRRKLDLKEADTVWVLFNSYAVVLHVD